MKPLRKYESFIACVSRWFQEKNPPTATNIHLRKLRRSNLPKVRHSTAFPSSCLMDWVSSYKCTAARAYIFVTILEAARSWISGYVNMIIIENIFKNLGQSKNVQSILFFSLHLIKEKMTVSFGTDQNL